MRRVPIQRRPVPAVHPRHPGAAPLFVRHADSGLLVRTVDRLLDEDSGFESRRALTARLMLADRMFIDGGAATAFVDTLLERVRGLPRVQAARGGQPVAPPTRRR